jgi:phage tail-like protein
MTATGVPLGLSWLPFAAGGWALGVRPLPPYMTFNFAVEIEVQVEEYREGGLNDFVHKLPGPASHANLLLQHGLTSLSTLWTWYYNTTQGVIQRRNGTIILLDARQIPVMWWNFRNGLPVRWTGPSFNASSEQVGVEALELVHEGLTKPLLGQAAALVHGIADLAGR